MSISYRGAANSRMPKKHPSIACCGIDCGLCPRYYTEGASRCPGCGAANFREKHPSCSILTCCFTRHGFETCAECDELPCARIKNWDKADSFVTHLRTLSNLELIRAKGLSSFLKQQKTRMQLLQKLISEYDDGRSKSHYCLSTALLPLAQMKQSIRGLKGGFSGSFDRKAMAIQLREAFARIATDEGLRLKYRK